MDDEFDSEEFYELMQAYRWSGVTQTEMTVAAFEAVKQFARSVVRDKLLCETQAIHEYRDRCI